MEKGIYDHIKEKFDQELLIHGNKLHFCSFVITMGYINFLLFLGLAKYIEKGQKKFIAITFLYFITILITLIIDIKTKWKSKYVRYIYFVVYAVAEIATFFNAFTYEDIMVGLWLIPISAVFVDWKFVSLNSILSLIIVFYGYYIYDISGSKSIWNSIPLVIDLICAVVFIKLSIKLRKMLYESKVEEYKITESKIDLNLAQKIQMGLLKEKIEEKDVFAVKGIIKPSKEISGDFYDYYMVDDKRLVVLIGDVSGKGLAASLFAAYVKTVICDYVKNEISFEKSLEKANKSVFGNNKELEFVTIFIGIINLCNGEMNYINAGHCCPIIMHKDGTTELLKSKPDFVFGVNKLKKYHSKKYSIGIGDKLILYTDGITERFNSKRELYGKERFMQSISNNKNKEIDELMDGILYDLNVYSEDTVQNDDITCVIFDYKNVFNIEEPLYKEFLIDEKAHKDCISIVKDYLINKNVPSEVIRQMVVVTDEIISNIIKYAYDEKVRPEDRIFALSINVVRNVIKVIYYDEGNYFNPLTKVNMSGSNRVTVGSKIGGLGIQLAFNLMDDMEYERQADMNILKVYKEF